MSFANSLAECLNEDKNLIEQSLERKKSQILFKHVFDVLASMALIIILSPVFLLVAILIKATSSGPVFYCGYRIGYKGRSFKCYKFRSMFTPIPGVNTHHLMPALIQMEKGKVYKVKNDSRVTLIGKLIRKTSIDELPQLFNVLYGNMSIVGPRPAVPYFMKEYKDFSDIRCLMKPGITGLWQIYDREHNTCASSMLEYDLDYVKNYSLYLDLKILLKTPFAIASCKGAF